MSAVVVPTRTAKAWDVVLSIILMALTLLTGLVGGFSVVLSAAFTDYCPPTSCHPGVGLAEVFLVWLVTTVLVLVLWVVTIIRLVRRRRGWWVATIALVLVVVAVVLEFFVYAGAVGYF